MEYTNSPLVVYTKLSKNYNKRSDAPKYGYTESIKNIVVHHMAGALSLETCGQVFQTGGGSSNYGVDNQGRVGMYVEEKNRAWTSDTRRDFESITIEVANTPETVHKTWEVSDAAIKGLINLCVDICQRNGIKALIWSNNKATRKSGANGCNMYVHRDYAATYCPGDYLLSKLPYVAEQVNAILSGTIPAPVPPAPAPVPTPESPIAKPTLMLGNSGTEVLKLQKNLNRFGYHLGEDGIFGSRTFDALKGWQLATGLASDGIYGPASYSKMQALLK